MKNMGVSLRSHQEYAVEHLRNGSILHGGVGSGKSRASLAYFFLKVCEGSYTEPIYTVEKPRDLYIITTARKRDTLEWEKECSNFQLTSYEQHQLLPIKVTIDSWNNIKKYQKIYGAFFIFDEQRLVGSGAWVKAFYQIAKRNQWIILSATPGDTWSDYIPVFVANGFFKNKTEFRREHIAYKPNSRYPQIEKYLGTKKLEELKRQITVDMEFERETTMHSECIFLDYDRDRYKECTRNRWDPFKNGPIADASGLCYCLRRICNEDPARIEATQKFVEEHERVIIFYNFDYELAILRNICEDFGVTYAEWNGHKHMDVPVGERWVYLTQYAAGAEAWNCTTTNCILFYSPNYSYKIMKQSSGRIDRMDTPYKDLYVTCFASTSPIDRTIIRTLQKKQKFNENQYVAKNGFF